MTIDVKNYIKLWKIQIVQSTLTLLEIKNYFYKGNELLL